MRGRQVVITIFDDLTVGEVRVTKDFKGDDLTSPEQQAILWLREQEGDPLDD